MHRRTLALILVVCGALVASPLWRAAALADTADAKRPRAGGDLFIFGHVLLDGSDAANGTFFFSGSEILTDEGARADLSLGASGRAELLPQSALRLDFGEGFMSGALGAGGVRVSKPEGVSAAFKMGDGSALAGPYKSAIFTVSYEGGRTTVETQAGEVRLRLKEREVVVVAGERFTAGQNAPSASNNLSGKKKAGIFLAFGGALAFLILLLANNHNDNLPIFIPPPIQLSLDR
jgi:ferric-dicitrate binding protein FerR (iron transport regulator)